MCYDTVWAVVDAVNEHFKIDFPFKDPAALDVLERGFASKSRLGKWRGQVLAVDGAHFAQRNPGTAVDNPLKYFVARKDEYALLCMAGCDALRRIRAYDISQTPTTHDSMAFACSDFGKRLINGELPPPYFFSGDSAFVLSNSMVVPAGTKVMEDFDFEQSSNRMPIECAFGILVRRWGLLWRPLSMRFDRRAPVIGALIRLHNFCIDERIEDETKSVNGLSEIQPGRWEVTPVFDRDGRPVEFLKTTNTRAQPDAAATRTDRRDKLALVLRQNGLVRPSRRRQNGRFV
jgi:hypothetical protein